jgi:hypothetical protein
MTFCYMHRPYIASLNMYFIWYMYTENGGIKICMYIKWEKIVLLPLLVCFYTEIHYCKYVQNELTWICKGHMRCIERDATIHKRNIHDREKKIVFCVVYAYAVVTLRRECVLIQNLTWYICNVILIHLRILILQK